MEGRLSPHRHVNLIQDKKFASRLKYHLFEIGPYRARMMAILSQKIFLPEVILSVPMLRLSSQN